METIKDTIKSVVQALGVKQKALSADSPAVILKKALTRKELGHIKFNYFRKGILSIKVDSSSWLYHLSLQKEDLLAKLRKRSKAIKDIHFCIGETK